MSTATTYYSNRTTSNQQPKAVEGMGGLIADVCTLVLSQWYTGDKHILFWLPRGCTILKWAISVSASIDSGSASTIEVGTFDSLARFFAAEAFGQGAASTVADYTASGPVAGILPYVVSTTQISTSGFLTNSNAMNGAKLPNPDIVNAFTSAVGTASGTYVTGATLKAYILYTMDPGTDTQ